MPRVKVRENSEKELQIHRALNDLHSKRNLSIHAAGKKYSLPRSTLANRYHERTKPNWEAHEEQQLMTKEEEISMEAWIGRLDDLGIPPRVSHLYGMAASILRQRSTPLATTQSNIHIGDYWVTRFLDRHPDIAYRFSTHIDNERAAAGNPETINQFFNRLSEVRSRFQIEPDNTYNADEIGYAIGQAKQVKVFARRIRKTSRVRQPGNREWVSVLECVSVRGKVIPAYLIYKGKAHLMGNHDYQERDESSFGLSNTGWSDEKHGFLWLSTHFDPLTATPTNKHRLLIIDGHSSHLSFEFIEYCLNHNIHLSCLPSHSTHLLQPLDVGLFSPLKRYYSNLLDLWTRTHPHQRLNKGDFFPLLMEARRSTFTEKNIRSAFATTGIFPFRRHQVLDILQHVSTAPPPNLNSAPTTTRQIQHLRQCAKNSENLKELKAICVQLATAAGTSTALTDKVIAQETIWQLTTTQKKSKIDKKQISKARVLSRTDLDRLRKLRLEQEKKKAEASARREASTQRKTSVQQEALKAKGKKRSRNTVTVKDLPVAKRQHTLAALDSDSK